MKYRYYYKEYGKLGVHEFEDLNFAIFWAAKDFEDNCASPQYIEDEVGDVILDRGDIVNEWLDIF
jgi:hypothetical protein